MEQAGATEILVVTPDDDLRLNRFIQGFLSDNGFPFVMVRSEPDAAMAGGGVKRVIFEDDEISRRFRAAWRAQALGVQGRA